MQLAASCMLFLHATGGQLHAIPPVFSSTLQKQFLEFKNEDAI
jgi:hypothetical protein